MQLGSTSNIFVVCQQCCEWSGYAELFTQDTLEVTGEMGVNISVSTLQVSAHFLKVDWIFRKCAGHVKEADVMKWDLTLFHLGFLKSVHTMRGQHIK